MAKEEFKPGDTVRLKSGGPLMTVDTVNGDTVRTVWFEGTTKKQSNFPAVTLEHDDGP